MPRRRPQARGRPYPVGQRPAVTLDDPRQRAVDRRRRRHGALVGKLRSAMRVTLHDPDRHRRKRSSGPEHRTWRAPTCRPGSRRNQQSGRSGLYFRCGPRQGLNDSQTGLTALRLLASSRSRSIRILPSARAQGRSCSHLAGIYALSAAEAQVDRRGLGFHPAIAIAPRLASGYAARGRFLVNQLDIGAALRESKERMRCPATTLMPCTITLCWSSCGVDEGQAWRARAIEPGPRSTGYRSKVQP